MVIAAILLFFSVFALYSQVTTRNKLKENLESAQEPEEIIAFQNAISKATGSIIFLTISSICLLFTFLLWLNAPS